MKQFIIFAVLCISMSLFAQEDTIYLIVRADDIGSSHTANVACIESFQNGIARTVEVMAPCSWFLEAARMLRENHGYDVGVHVTLTAEWDEYKWGPLTHAPSIVDSNGYFHPKQKDWAEDGSPAFWNDRVDMVEVEAEVRAQIELAINHIPQVSHFSGHMGIFGVSDEMRALSERLAKEYNLEINLDAYGVKWARWGINNDAGFEERESALIQMLESLESGLYLLVEHPGLDTPEMHATGHTGYENVAAHRDAVTKAFTSKKVQKVIESKSIQLISYADAKRIF